MDEYYNTLERMVGERLDPLNFIGKRTPLGKVFTREEVLSDLEKVEKEESIFGATGK